MTNPLANLTERPMIPLDKFQASLLNYKSEDVLWLENASQRLREIEQEERANALRAPRHSAKPEPQSPLSFVPSGECHISQGKDA